MKITKEYLQKVIKEELENVLTEVEDDAKMSSAARDAAKTQRRTGAQIDRKMDAIKGDSNIIGMAVKQAMKVLDNAPNPKSLIPKFVAAVKAQAEKAGK
tara:strand:- start:1091 stop:1387 length:297 start_codon:yes stop_codon:yes gene_type:complete